MSYCLTKIEFPDSKTVLLLTGECQAQRLHLASRLEPCLHASALHLVSHLIIYLAVGTCLQNGTVRIFLRVVERYCHTSRPSRTIERYGEVLALKVGIWRAEERALVAVEGILLFVELHAWHVGVYRCASQKLCMARLGTEYCSVIQPLGIGSIARAGEQRQHNRVETAHKLVLAAAPSGPQHLSQSAQTRIEHVVDIGLGAHKLGPQTRLTALHLALLFGRNAL